MTTRDFCNGARKRLRTPSRCEHDEENVERAVAISYLGRQLAHRKLKLLVSRRFHALLPPHLGSVVFVKSG